MEFPFFCCNFAAFFEKPTALPVGDNEVAAIIDNAFGTGLASDCAMRNKGDPG